MQPERRLLYIFTRTPLHVGAGASVGAIDQPIIRERHTGFPVVPATSLKGTFADCWNERAKAKTTKNDHEEEVEVIRRSAEGCWLFGEPDADNAAAGALQFTEARLLAFPVRSARGSFAWITCPLILRRAARDGVLPVASIISRDLSDEQALFAVKGPLAIADKVVLEEYTFTHAGELPAALGNDMANLITDFVWAEVASRLVILSDGMMSFFARNACEIAQHVRINDETGAAAKGALFNQENVPSETMFYCVVHAFRGRAGSFKNESPSRAFETFCAKLQDYNGVFQFGGDASTGLGYCTVTIASNTKSS
ncbi:MAG: type III-B CRISPR module RAMP protein Cmr4 [Verrucomicrobia bacterium]|nr:type III-B CRISPR module RAMP protein Cmr4 [Verrucomicrobiota bacterium]